VFSEDRRALLNAEWQYRSDSLVAQPPTSQRKFGSSHLAAERANCSTSSPGECCRRASDLGHRTVASTVALLRGYHASGPPCVGLSDLSWETLELVTIARESESEAQCGVPFEGTLHEGFQACAWPATPTPSHFTRLLLRCTLLACELALAVAVSLASGEGWGNVERHLTSGTDFLKRAVVLACGDREEGVPFAPGGAGLRALWGIVHGPLASIVPVALWSASQIPKVSGKKAKSGSESLVAARQALRAFLQSVQTILTDLHAQLGSCQEFDIARPRGVLRITALDGLPDMDKYRERVSKVTCEAHQKQCFALREVVAARLTLVKSKSSFKV